MRGSERRRGRGKGRGRRRRGRRKRRRRERRGLRGDMLRGERGGERVGGRMRKSGNWGREGMGRRRRRRRRRRKRRRGREMRI